MVYEVVSSRYERTTFTAAKIRTLLEMGIISAGVKLVNDELVVAPLEKPKKEETAEKKEETATLRGAVPI